jgi:hypothetical protein
MNVDEASRPVNHVGVSLRREGLEGPVGSQRNPDDVSSLVELELEDPLTSFEERAPI